MAEMPVIDWGKCNDCGLCVDICVCGVFVMTDEGVSVVEVEECSWCTLCEVICPTGAISCPFEIVIENNQD